MATYQHIVSAYQHITIIIDQLRSLLRAAEHYALHSPSVRGRRFASRTARDTYYLLGQANYLYRVLRDDAAFSPRADSSIRPRAINNHRSDRVRITTALHRGHPPLLWASGYQTSAANIRLSTSTELELLGVGQVDITEFYNST